MDMVPSDCKDWTEAYKKVNYRLGKNGKVLFDESDGSFHFAPPDDCTGLKSLYYPKIGIYTGGGASHSWLWFVELFETIGLYDLCFVEERDIQEERLYGLDILCIGGGDTFAIAEALAQKGAEVLRKFIERGGGYFGSCAGAYLLLDLKGPPFTPFSHFTKVQLANLSPVLPECFCMPTKFYSSYNGEYVIHPVREGVMLEPTKESFSRCRHEYFTAPLYGGPAMEASEEETVFARYAGFTDSTLYLGDKKLARTMFTGKAAGATKRLGKGSLWLFGPHFEHPQYPEANRVIAETIYRSLSGHMCRPYFCCAERIGGTVAHETITILKKELSNARIMSSGLETYDLRWVIGKKSYEPEKIRLFLETIWKRLPFLLKKGDLAGSVEDSETLKELFPAITNDIKSLAAAIQKDEESTPVATRLFHSLKRATAIFLKFYFRNRLEVLQDQQTQ